jgi:glycosyltransferase involved in cell wall biosynthesis
MEVRDLWPAIFIELGVLKNPFLIGMLEMLELWLYRRASRVVTVTNSFRGNLISRGVPPEKVVNISNGVDLDYWVPQACDTAFKKGLGLEDKFVVLYIGAHGISHALTRILECAGQLKEYPEIQFVFVGDGAEKPTLIEYARRENLENVSFYKSVNKNQVSTFYALSDVCLVPLRDIPLFGAFIPSKIFEIMAMARPIIASLHGEAAEIINRSGGGIVVEPEDVAAIKKAILNLFENKKLRLDLGQNGHRFVRENYSRKMLADKYLSILEDAINSCKGYG